MSSLNSPGTNNGTGQKETIGDAVNYVAQNPGVLGTIYAGVREIMSIIALIFKPSAKIGGPK